MKKRVIIISAITGIFIIGLCAKFIIGNRDVPVTENDAVEVSVVFSEANVQSGQELTEPEETEEVQQDEIEPEATQAVQEPERQDKFVVSGQGFLNEPVAMLNNKKGKLRYDWSHHVIQVEEDTLLFVSDCYFSQEKLQQRIFYLAKAPLFIPQEVFRQDTRVFEEEPYGGMPELLERRMPCLKVVEEGYVYEADGVLYYLDKEFQETVLLCDLKELLGENYLFSPWGADKNKCDVTADASRLLVCTDEGLYEYNLENKERKLLESAVFSPYEVVHEEGDCDCGETGFEFDGPIEAEYVPGEQGYVFLTGTEYGNPTEVTLRSAEGATLYQKEIKGYVGEFRWIESEDTVYLAVFYQEDGSAWMERVDVHTGEHTIFVLPDEVFWLNDLCVGFLDADHLVYSSEQATKTKGKYEIYRLSDEENQKQESTGEVNQKVIVISFEGYKIIVKYKEYVDF